MKIGEIANIYVCYLFLLLFFSLHYLFYSRVVKKLLVSDNTKKRLVLMLAVNYLFNIAYVIGRYTDFFSNTLFYLFSLSIGTTFVLFLYLLLHEIVNLFHKSIKNTKRLDASRREFIKKSGDCIMFTATASYVSIGAHEGNKKPAVNIVKLSKFNFSIAQISDLHIGGLIDKEFVKYAVDKINALSADIVCITGDLIDTKLDGIKSIVKELDNIKAKHGVYYILGNHEYFHDLEEIITFMQDSKLTLLLNENIQIDSLKLNIVGVTDLIGYRMELLEPNIDKAFSGCNEKYKTILLAHQPKFIEELGAYSPELILSGHTHGGQIWPFNYLVRLQQPYVKGLHELPNGSHIYVNSGIRFWGPPMRLGSHAEITYLI